MPRPISTFAPRFGALSLLLALAPTLSVALFAQADAVTALERVTVFAGQLPTGELPGAVLNSLEVVKTPGAAADINRALQTLPGIQLSDEGNALFVRGGDSFETTTLVNGLRYPSVTRLNAPAGNFTGTLNPFEARRITFASGGFGARFGNALSGVVDIDTLGAPPVHSLSLGGGLGALSLGASAAFTEHAGVRLMATRSSVAPITWLNGAARNFPEPPNGHDFAATAAWEYRPGAELRVFGVEQVTHLALDVNLPTQRGLFRQAIQNRLGSLSWTDAFGRWTTHLNLGGGTLARRETVGTVDADTSTRHRQWASYAGYDANDRVQFSFGVDGARENTALAKVIPPSGRFAGGTFRDALSGTRTGVFAEADAMLLPHLRAVAGARLDDSTLTQRTTVDPRVSLAWEPRRALTFSVAGGGYHQIPEAYHFIGDTGRVVLPPMRVNQLLGAVQLGKNNRFARFEIYSKDYADLVTLNRAYRPVAGGRGRAEGCDVFLKSPLPFALTGRVTYSYVDTRRTDPDSGRMAPAAFDVTHTAALILERSIGAWSLGAGWRYASGRPITPIVGGVADGRGGLAPVYGTPFSERLPSLTRLDLNASRYTRLDAHRTLVLYASITNALNRDNVYTYEYSRDFTTRQPTPSLFKRSLYLGFSLQFN